MPRHRLGAGVDLHLRLDPEILELIDQEVERAGVPRRTVVERAIRARLGRPSEG